jgi:glutaredoxin
MKPVLVLYHFESCPFCQKVRNFIKSEGLSILEKDIRLDADAEEELIRVGGKAQVPCLFIDGKPLYESSDIITWIKENHNVIK